MLFRYSIEGIIHLLEKIEFYFYDIGGHMVHISKVIALLTYFRGYLTFMVFRIINVSLNSL